MDDSFSINGILLLKNKIMMKNEDAENLRGAEEGEEDAPAKIKRYQLGFFGFL